MHAVYILSGQVFHRPCLFYDQFFYLIWALTTLGGFLFALKILTDSDLLLYLVTVCTSISLVPQVLDIIA